MPLSYKKKSLNFIISLLLSKLKDVVYNAILIIIFRFIKIIKYLSIIIKIDVVELAKVFYIKIIYRYKISNKIISDKELIFINNF